MEIGHFYSYCHLKNTFCEDFSKSYICIRKAQKALNIHSTWVALNQRNKSVSTYFNFCRNRVKRKYCQKSETLLLQRYMGKLTWSERITISE